MVTRDLGTLVVANSHGWILAIFTGLLLLMIALAVTVVAAVADDVADLVVMSVVLAVVACVLGGILFCFVEMGAAVVGQCRW